MKSIKDSRQRKSFMAAVSLFVNISNLHNNHVPSDDDIN
jgi:hypothetical protein